MFSASLAALGAAVGCLISRSMINSFGPRGTVLLSHVICAIGWILTISSLTTTNFLTGRVLTGVFVGIVSVAASAHSTECFPSRPTARPVVYTAIGVLCIYLIGSLLNYSQTAAVVLMATIISFVFTRWFVPESPSWLESRGRVGDAEYSKLKLRVVTTTDTVENTMNDISFRQFRQPDVYRPFMALCLHFALQQLSGPLIIVTYATQFVDDSGVRVLNTYFVAVVLAVCLVVGSLISTAMNHRESTTILSSTGIVAAGIVITVYNLSRRLFLNRFGSQLLSFIPLLALIVFMMSSSVALVPNLPVNNMVEHIALSFSYLFAFGVIKTYPYVHAYLGWWVFGFFTIAAALNIVFGVLMFSSESESKRAVAKVLTVPAV